ncbi:MAG: ABC transporter ATP-binding protein [Actinomycetota bacterium]
MTTSADESSSVAIDVSGIGFSYGEIRAVDDVSFSVERGEILGFLGPNGAGKSTTIKMVTGQLTAESGTIEVLGMDMPRRREDIQGRLGVCFEEKNLYASMTGRENLVFFARLFGVADFEPEPLMEQVGLSGRLDDRVSEYSKGMRQRLMMARALVNTPDVLLLDEPTDGLDPVSAIAIREMIRREADRGAAVLLTTHDMHEADTLSDRVAFINQGSILTIDTPDNLKLEYGQRSVRVRSRRDSGVEERVIALDDAGSADQIRDAISDGGLMTIHTEEATLEDIFVEFAGRGLGG